MEVCASHHVSSAKSEHGLKIAPVIFSFSFALGIPDLALTPVALILTGPEWLLI